MPNDFPPFSLCVLPVFFLSVPVSLEGLALTMKGDFQIECFWKVLQVAISK